MENPLFQFNGFLVRRVWQIHVAMFMEATKGISMTPVQFSLLLALRAGQGVDQATLGAQIAVDRSSLADTIKRLHRSGLVSRRRGSEDRREMIISLTDSGEALVRLLENQVKKTHAQLVEDLAPREQEVFQKLLQKIVTAKNDLGRAKYAIRFPEA